MPRPRLNHLPIFTLALASTIHFSAAQTVYNTTVGQFAAAQVELLPSVCEPLLLLSHAEAFDLLYHRNNHCTSQEHV